jgi:hypothetical protein
VISGKLGRSWVLQTVQTKVSHLRALDVSIAMECEREGAANAPLLPAPPPPSMSDVVAFDKAHARMGLSEGNAVVTRTEGDYRRYRTAASGAVLKGGGLHMVQLTLRQGYNMVFGLIRADWDVEGAEDTNWVQGHCFYSTGTGRRNPGNIGWEGMQSAKKNDRIGLLLDLDAGSLTVYKNDERLGVMQKSGPGFGLTDAAGYRWAVALYNKGDSARIDAVPVAEPARLIAQHAALQDTALPAGTRLRVEGLGDGVYERWERKTFGANAHFLDFGVWGGVQQVALRSLAPWQWSVLPPLAAPVVTVRALEVAGGEAVEVEGVSLDWSVSQLNAAIAERRGRAAELQRLVLGGVALDDEDALLSSCGVVDGTEVHALAQEAGAAATRRAVAAAAGGAVAGGGGGGGGGGVIAQGQPPVAAEQAQERRGGGGGWLCCASPQ